MRRRGFIRRSSTALLVTLALGVFVDMAKATINETLSCALEAAMPYVEKGFTVREDNWQGKFALDEKKAIKHQLFKGNEYWFWLGSSTPGVTLSIKIYDTKGRPVDVETKVDKTSAAARVLAPKTGTYYIVIKAVATEAKQAEDSDKGEDKDKDEGKDEEKEKDEDAPKKPLVEWAVVYGFR